MIRIMKKPVLGILDRVQHKAGLKATKDPRGLKFRLEDEEGFYYLCNEIKGTDQLCGYRATDLRLYFLTTEKRQVFSCSSSKLLQDKSKKLGFTSI